MKCKGKQNPIHLTVLEYALTSCDAILIKPERKLYPIKSLD